MPNVYAVHIPSGKILEPGDPVVAGNYKGGSVEPLRLGGQYTFNRVIRGVLSRDMWFIEIKEEIGTYFSRHRFDIEIVEVPDESPSA